MLHELVADLVCLPYKFRLDVMEDELEQHKAPQKKKGKQSAMDTELEMGSDREADDEMDEHETSTQSSPGITHTQMRRAVGEVDKTETLFCKELFESPPADRRIGKDSSPHFSKRLYDIISKESYSVGLFPLRPGKHLDLGPPQLELLKQVCHIFALDNDVKDEVANMKRALLRFLKVLHMPLMCRPPGNGNTIWLIFHATALQSCCYRLLVCDGLHSMKKLAYDGRCVNFLIKPSSRTPRARSCFQASCALPMRARRHATWTSAGRLT